MKRLVLISLFCFSLHAQDDVATVTELVSLTKKTLHEQENLLKELIEFQKKRELFLADPDSAKLATQLVRASMRLEKCLESQTLSHLLSEDLLTEVHFFAKVGKEKR